MQLDPHPLADLAVFTTTWPAPLGALSTPAWLRALTAPDAACPLPPPGEHSKAAVRDLLRHGGFKPAGRSKPCSEYLQAALDRDAFPWINPAVDACNVAVLRSGLPASTIDADLLTGPLRVGLAPAGARYVFNASGQEIDLAGLLVLFDAHGPCSNAVKDAQRVKTHPGTTRTLSIVWGSRALPGHTDATSAWHRELLTRLGATSELLPSLAPAHQPVGPSAG